MKSKDPLKNNASGQPSAEENISAEGEMNSEIQSADSDLTQDDLEALGPIDLSMDDGEDELLKHREYPLDFSGDDLDIPGSELDDANEEIGSEDEENNSYSLGGDNHEDLEEDHS